MNLTTSTNRKFKRMFVNVLSIIVILAMAFPVTGGVSAQEANPHFTIFPQWDWFDGWDWPDGTVTITVADKGACDTEGISSGGFFNGGFPGGCDIVVGDQVTFTFETTMRTHTVRELSVTAVDADADTVAGTSDPNTIDTVYVWPHCCGEYAVQPLTSGGAWLAEFPVEFDLEPGMDGRAEIHDGDGNATAVDWHAPKPRFTVYPVWEAIEAWDWPDGAPVTASVVGKPECITDGVPGYPDWDPWTTNVWMNFPPGCDVVEGDEVILGATGLPDVSHTVRNLSVTDVNADADTVTGMADPSVTVHVWPHGFGEYEVQPTAGDDHVWVADFFSEFGDILEPGMDGRSEVRDVNGNATAIDWHTPKPRFTVYPVWEAVEAWDWPDGVLVSASVVGKSECIADGVTGYPEWDPSTTNVWMNFPEDCDVVAGDEVILSADGVTPVLHTVRNLSVTDVNAENDTVTGTADTGMTVYVWPHGFGEYELQPTAGDDNVWVADFFSEFGDVLQPGMDGRSEVRDVNGNATAVDWRALIPRFTVFPEWEWFDGNDWPDGAIVTITVAGKDQCETTKESWDYFFNGSFGEGCDLEIGDTVTFTDGETIRTHTVQNLTVTKANHDDDTIKGIADPGAEVYVWPHATGEQQLVIAKTEGAAKGKWNVDFSGIYDIAPGECGRSEIRDEFANSTAVDWCISNPRIVASESGDWFWTTEFRPGDLDISIYDSQDVDANLLWSGQQVADESGFAFVGSDIHGQDLVPGNYLVVSDGDSEKSLVLQPIAVILFDTEYEFMAGFAPPGSEVWAAAGLQDWQERITVQADPLTGAWLADFKTIGFDLTEEMRSWSYAHIYDEDGDANEGSIPPLVDNAIVIANQPDWVDSGITFDADQSFTIEAIGLMNPCSDTYPNGAEYCIFYTPEGAEGVVPDQNEFGIFPGPGLRFMALLGRIGDGDPFYVGEGGTFTAEQSGTLWFTPNDNLRMDNQGAYSVMVWLEP